MFRLGVVVLCLLCIACEDENEHFCSKYQFYHNRLTEPGVLAFSQLKPQLNRDLKKKSKAADDAKMALLVIRDIELGLIKKSESARDYCLRRKRWEVYK